MMDRMKRYWAARSAREQHLLLVAGVLAALVLLGLVVRPVMQWTQQMQSAHREAVEREGRVLAKAALLAVPARAAGAGDASHSAALDQYVAQSASELGLVLTRSDARGTDSVNIAMNQAKAQVVTMWLAELERQNMVLDNLTLTPQADGSLAVTADVRRVAR
jgi:general secretion pathway protein M